MFEGLKKFRVDYRGYETDRVDGAEVLAIVRDREHVRELRAGERGLVILDVTPFYAEAGGQIGDSGRLWSSASSGRVHGAFYPVHGLIAHDVEVTLGTLGVGDRVDAAVDSERRRAISGNHTATHLLHAALRLTLGDHVKQSGSLVSAERLRFDFTHFSPLGREELRKVESLVNEKIRENLRVETRVVSLEEGVREGAMAIFEEKYGEKVRMVMVGEFSRELCGGGTSTPRGKSASSRSSPSRVSPRACGASRPWPGTGLSILSQRMEDEQKKRAGTRSRPRGAELAERVGEIPGPPEGAAAGNRNPAGKARLAQDSGDLLGQLLREIRRRQGSGCRSAIPTDVKKLRDLADTLKDRLGQGYRARRRKHRRQGQCSW